MPSIRGAARRASRSSPCCTATSIRRRPGSIDCFSREWRNAEATTPRTACCRRITRILTFTSWPRAALRAAGMRPGTGSRLWPQGRGPTGPRSGGASRAAGSITRWRTGRGGSIGSPRGGRWARSWDCGAGTSRSDMARRPGHGPIAAMLDNGPGEDSAKGGCDRLFTHPEVRVMPIDGGRRRGLSSSRRAPRPSGQPEFPQQAASSDPMAPVTSRQAGGRRGRHCARTPSSCASRTVTAS